MDEDEVEMVSESTLLYPTMADMDDKRELDANRRDTRYLFPDSEFEPDEPSAGTSSRPTKGEIVRNAIIQDVISLVLHRVVPRRADSPRNYERPPVTRYRILTRDEIIQHAMEQARISRTHRGQPLHTQTLLSHRTNLNTMRKIPPIRTTDDPDLQELMEKGKSRGYSEAALLKTRRDNNTHRLTIPSKEEAETVDVWRLEEKYRTSISKLKGYTTL